MTSQSGPQIRSSPWELAVAPAPGTVVGKALETLESGTGLIQVLVTPR